MMVDDPQKPVRSTGVMKVFGRKTEADTAQVEVTVSEVAESLPPGPEVTVALPAQKRRLVFGARPKTTELAAAADLTAATQAYAYDSAVTARAAQPIVHLELATPPEDTLLVEPPEPPVVPQVEPLEPPAAVVPAELPQYLQPEPELARIIVSPMQEVAEDFKRRVHAMLAAQRLNGNDTESDREDYETPEHSISPLDSALTDELQHLLIDKVEEFHLLGYGEVTAAELWQYLQGIRKNRPNNLHDLVNAILCLQPQAFMNQAMKKMYQPVTMDDFKELL